MEETGETQFENHVFSWNSFFLVWSKLQNSSKLVSRSNPPKLSLSLYNRSKHAGKHLGLWRQIILTEGGGLDHAVSQTLLVGWIPILQGIPTCWGGDYTDCNVWTYIMIQAATKPILGNSDRHCRLNSVHHAATVLDAKEENCQRRWSVRQHCSQLVPTLTDFLADFPAVFF